MKGKIKLLFRYFLIFRTQPVYLEYQNLSNLIKFINSRKVSYGYDDRNILPANVSII